MALPVNTTANMFKVGKKRQVRSNKDALYEKLQEPTLEPVGILEVLFYLPSLASHSLYASLNIDQDLHLIVLIFDQCFEPSLRDFTHLDLLRDHTFGLDFPCSSWSVFLA